MKKFWKTLVTRFNHPYLFQVNPPFYPSALLLCCDDIKYWGKMADVKAKITESIVSQQIVI